MFTMDDMLAIVKPHHDKIIAEGKAERLEKQNARLVAALREVEEYFDDQADVDDGIPNDAMRMLVIVRAALNGERLP